MTTTRRFGRLATIPAVLLLVGIAWGQVQPERIEAVRFRGNEVLSDEAMLGLIRTRAGMAYGEDLVRADERRLLATGRFDSVVATRTQAAEGVIVTFLVRERPTIRSVEFQGNREFTNVHLSRTAGLRAGAALNPIAIETARVQLVTAYQDRGYHDVRVDIDAEALQQRRVVFRIFEGPRIRIGRIRYEGNESFSWWRLRRQIESRRRLWPLEPGNLDLSEVEQDVVRLRSFYASEGFFDVQIGRRVEIDEHRQRAELTFIIDEGPRFRVNRITFTGNEIYLSEALRGRLDMEAGDFLQQRYLERDVQRLEHAYGEIGYADATVTPRRIFLPPDDESGNGAMVDLEFEVREGRQYRVGEIIIRGNEVTQDRVIRRELTFFPQQIYNEVAIEESVHRLRQTAYFHPDIRITPLDRPGDVRDVVIEVMEGQTTQLLLGLGVSSQAGLIGNIALRQRNFDPFAWPESVYDLFFGRGLRGAGQEFGLSADVGTELHRFMVSWRDPRIYDTHYSLGGNASFFTRRRESYDEERLGTMLSIGRGFENRWYAELGARVESVRLRDLAWHAPGQVRRDAERATLLGLRPTLVRDRTDSRWLPTRGDRFEIGYEQVVGDHTFGDITAEYSRHWTVYRDGLDRSHVLSGRVATGYMPGSPPVYERYYGGGLGSVRGFAYRGISPRGGPKHEPVGGSFLLGTSAEYGFPLVDEVLRGVLFVDGGTVEDRFTVTTFRIGAGFGFRLYVPQFGPAPMQFDFGFPLVRDAADDRQVFSFSVGWSF